MNCIGFLPVDFMRKSWGVGYTTVLFFLLLELSHFFGADTVQHEDRHFLVLDYSRGVSVPSIIN